MNLAQLVQSQNFATLLQALDAAGELTAGRTVEARLLSLEADGTATAAIGDAKVALVLAGPQARQAAALQPGATLLLRLDPPEQPGGELRATLVETRPPAASPAPAPAPTPPQAPATTPAAMPVAAAPPGNPVSKAPPTAPASSPPPATTASPALAASPAARPALPSAGTIASGPPATAPAAAPAQAGSPPAALTGPAPLAPAAARALAGPLLGPVLQRQDSLAPLLANLRGLAQGTIALTLPKPLLAAIDQVLAQSVPAERPVTAQSLKQAFQGSGLFLEARQTSGAPAPRQGDLKAGLQALREALLPIVDALSPDPKAGHRESAAMPAGRMPEGAADIGTEQAAHVPPPRRDGPLLPQAATEPTLAPGEKPLVIAETLLDQTEAALDRIKLAQYASLPPESGRQDGTQPAQRWLAEIPLAFQHGTAILPLQVERDAPRRDAQGVSLPLWRIRFALDVEPMGPLQGVVTLQGRDVGVTLWAERERTSQLLRGAAPGLETALLRADFASGAVDVHLGHPRVMQPTAGQFLDRLS